MKQIAIDTHNNQQRGVARFYLFDPVTATCNGHYLILRHAKGVASLMSGSSKGVKRFHHHQGKMAEASKGKAPVSKFHDAEGYEMPW